MSDERPGSDPVPPERLALRVDEAAASLGVSRRHFQAMLADRDLGVPRFKRGKIVLIPVREFREWLAGNLERLR